MPGEFVASPRHPGSSSPPEVPFGKQQDTQSVQQERRQSLESMDSVGMQKQSQPPSSSKSPIRSALSKAKSKFSSSKDKDVLPGSEEEYGKLKEKEEEKQKRKEEYEKLKLGNKVVFGQGSMNMSG